MHFQLAGFSQTRLLKFFLNKVFFLYMKKYIMIAMIAIHYAAFLIKDGINLKIVQELMNQ